jgi:hypothetical protein
MSEAQTRRRERRRGISLRALRTNYIAVHIVVELVIIKGIRETALHRGHIEGAFLMYFYYYISLNIILLPKL